MGSETDANIALAGARRLLREYRERDEAARVADWSDAESWRVHDRRQAENLAIIASYFGALDESLSTGGKLPDEWQSKRNRV